MFAALAAWLTYIQQERAAINSVRPELILSDWSYSKKGKFCTVRVGTVENAGNGHAFQVLPGLDTCLPSGEEAEFTGHASAVWMPILRRGELKNVQWELGSILPQAAAEDADPFLLTLRVVFWDVIRTRYRTTYTLMVSAKENVLSAGERVAPNLYLLNRRTEVTPTSRWSTDYH